MDKENLFQQFKVIINELFEVPLEDIKPESRFYEDLGLDSIDAIDLIGQMQTIVGERLDPEHFKSVLTVQDVVSAAEEIIQKKDANQGQ